MNLQVQVPLALMMQVSYLVLVMMIYNNNYKLPTVNYKQPMKRFKYWKTS